MVGSVEYLRGGTSLADGELNDPDITLRGVEGRTGRAIRSVASPAGARAVHVGRLVAGAALLAPTGRRVRMLAGGYLATTSYATMVVEMRGTDGSDEVAALVQTTMTVARVRPDPVVADAALWFLAMQSALSYFAAGVAKGASRTWTGGTALARIVRTQAYGHRATWQYLERHPELSRRLTQGIVVGEVALPFLLVGRHRFVRHYVATAAFFHAANGVIMGLGRFTVAFAGMYPGVLYVSSARSREGRSDVLPKVAFTLIGAAVGTTALRAASDSRQLARDGRDLRRHVCANGDRLAYQLDGSSDPSTPLVVFEAGLGAAAASWERIAGPVAAAGFGTLVYTRAPYRPSGSATSEITLDRLVDDLVDLVQAHGEHRPIVLVGHSLGGTIAARAASRLGPARVGLVLLDPGHPTQWHRVATSLAMSGRTMVLTRWSLQLGLGPAMEAQDELAAVDPAWRRRLLAFHRAPSTWRGMHAEIGAMRTVAEAGPAPLDPFEGATVVTASGTAELDQTQMDDDVRLASLGRHVVVERATHHGLVHDTDAAGRAVDEILAVAARRADRSRLDGVEGAGR